MTTVILIAGPPADTPLWADVAQRLRSHGLTAHAYPLFTDANSDGTASAEAGHLAAMINETEGPVVVTAHGTAIAIALHAASRARIAGLVLSNGPITTVDPMSRGLARVARLPGWAGRRTFSPKVLLPWLRSSLGLRRAVVNPYVMDHDTTVAVCGPLLGDPMRRERVRQFYRDLKSAVASAPAPATPCLFCWGDSDPLYPAVNLHFHGQNDTKSEVQTIAGGQHLHPIERPWELADRVAQWIENGPTTT